MLQLRAAHVSGPADQASAAPVAVAPLMSAAHGDTSGDEEQSNESLAKALEASRPAVSAPHREGSDESDEDVTKFMGKMAVSKVMQ